MADKTLCEIVSDWLKREGFEGLYLSDMECGCRLDDLMPCGSPDPHCRAGYLHKAPEWEDADAWIGPKAVERPEETK